MHEDMVIEVRSGERDRDMVALRILTEVVGAWERGDMVHANGVDFHYYRADGTYTHGNVVQGYVITHGTGIVRPRQPRNDVRAWSMRDFIARQYHVEV